MPSILRTCLLVTTFTLLSGCTDMVDNDLCDFWDNCEKEEAFDENSLCEMLGTCYKQDPLPCALNGDCGDEEAKPDDKKKEGTGGGATSTGDSGTHESGGGSSQ